MNKSSEDNIINLDYSSLDQKLQKKEISIKQKISEIEESVNSKNALINKGKFKHEASLADNSNRLTRSQLASIKIQNRRNFINFLIALSFSAIIFYLLLIVL
jgi:hypothetical protein